MSETRRAWTPEKVERLLGAVEDIAGWSMKLAEAEERVAAAIEKALVTAETETKAALEAEE